VKKWILWFVTVTIIMTVLLLSGSGCRPDTTVPAADTTTVVVEEDGLCDTLTGIWESDTLETTGMLLTVHQQNLEDVFFEYDSYELSGEALDVLMKNASYIMENEGFRVLVEGHCDERGTIDYNLSLGEKRALAVYEYLVNYGVPAERLEYISYGKERPFDPGHNERAWAANRRVHFRVLPGR